MKKNVLLVLSIIAVVVIVLFVVKNSSPEQKVLHYGGSIPGADFETFEKIDNDYGKDKNSAYVWWDAIEDSDSETFVVLGNKYSKDKNNVYYYDKKLDGVDLETFEIISGKTWHDDFYGKDKNTVWHGGTQIAGSDPNTFELFNDTDPIYSIDINNIYFKGGKLSNMTPETFEYLGNGYARNNDVIYYYMDSENPDSGAMVWIYELTEVQGAHADTFEPLFDFYAKDKNNYYRGTLIVEGVELLSLKRKLSEMD